MFRKELPRPNLPPPKKQGHLPSLFLIIATAFSVWLVVSSLHPHLPGPNEPPKLYSNQARLDLRLTLIEALRKTERSIYMVMFGLSDPSILDILSKKIQEFVPTTIYYDPMGSPNVRKMLKGGEVHPIKNSGLMHQKILILDEEMIFLGSANFTSSSLRMHDNLVVGFVNRKVANFLKKNAPHKSDTLRTMVGGQEIELWLLPDPKGHALDVVRKKIRSATRSIHCALFTFTHPTLAEELVRAHKRGVDVRVVLDLYSGIGASAQTVQYLKDSGVPIFFSQGPQLLHHKFAIIDDQTLLMGSANWTKAAFMKNSDCLLLLYNLDSTQKSFLQKLWHRVESEARKV